MIAPDQPSEAPRRRGRPLTPAPDGRDLENELEVLRDWLAARPGIKPATISKSAGLKAPTLNNMLRKKRRPQADQLDKIYEALEVYNYQKSPKGDKNN